tara:strand:+ start:276 stop:518 length:243 start_codon:yes stop_codon:yes gene_type:complete
MEGNQVKDFLMSSDEFEEYVLSFYGSDDGLYPFNCSDDTIRSAIHLVEGAGMDNETFAADSIDREKVRTVLETLRYKETK